jgi:type IV pilus assembly protein PilA
MKQPVQIGLILAELMLAVVIAGLIAAFALPAYQDYTVRAKVSEVLMALDGGKVGGG